MTSRSQRPRRRAIGASVLAATLGIAGLGLAASPASATADFELERLAGIDRVKTAVDIAETTFPDGTTEALIARDDLYPDALAGNYLAGIQEAPILLSDNADVQDDTMNALEALGVETVTLLGGTEALDDSVAAELEAAGYTVDREAGTDRYKTAADIATQDGATVGTTDDGATAILATGENFPDALTAGPLSYSSQFPILLTPSAALGDDAEGALVELDIEHVLIAGGTDAVSGTVEAELTALGMTSERLAGVDRYKTAVEIANYAVTNLGFVETMVNVATGRNFPDALTGGPHAGAELAPILLADDVNSSDAAAYIEAIEDTVASGHIFGGTEAVSAAVEAILEAAGQPDAPTTNQTFDVTPGAFERLTFVPNPDTDTTDDRQYSAAGLEDGTTYRIQLFPANNVTVDENGVVTFTEAGTTNTADEGAVAADITVVNGASTGTTPGTSAEAQPVNGQINFTVDGDGAESIVPVVYQDADSDDDLDLNADNEPTEAFGVGGETEYVPAEAAQGDVVAAGTAVDSVNKTEDYFTANNQLFEYDANDAYTVDSNQATFEQFEAALSSTDTIEVADYQPNETLQSTFHLADVNPAQPTGVTATQDGEAVEVAWTAPTGDVDSYNIYRAVSANGTDCTNTAATSYSVVGTDTATPFTDSSITVGEEYCYAVSAVNDGDEGDRSAADFVDTQTVDTVAPVSEDARVTSNILVGDSVTVGDEWKIAFSEDMDNTTAGDVIRLQDGDGSVSDVTCGMEASCSFNTADETVGGTTYSADRVLTVEVLSTPAQVTAGDPAGLQYPLTVVDSSGITDEQGNTWDEAGSPDRVIDEEA